MKTRLATVIRNALPVGALLLGVACGSSRPSYSTETTPPTLEWLALPPTVTISNAVKLNIKATSNLEVRTVYVSVGSTRTAAEQEDDGSWSANITLPVVGHNIVIAWGEDSASPTPNSGQGREAPYQLSADINYAPSPPSLSYDAAYGSYTDERNVNLVQDANGMAKMPPEYTIGPKVGIPPGGDIYKMSTRLSGGAMTAAELDTTNAKNIPVLRFAVVHNPNIDPPLETPTFVAQVTCTNCPSYPEATGSLLPSIQTDPARALFDLPISAETVPALAEIPGPSTVSFTITVRNTAGMETVAPGFNFTFHLIGPALAVTEDTQYPAAKDPASTYAYYLADNTYATLWNGPFPRVRLVRYVISNPTSHPVALGLSIQAAPDAWQAYESWTAYNIAERRFHGKTKSVACRDSFSYTLDGFTYREPYCSDWNGNRTFWHVKGDTKAMFVAPLPPEHPYPSGTESGVYSSATVSLLNRMLDPALGNQERAPDMDSTGQWAIVPAADAGLPGRLVVYVTRPTSAARTRALAWNLNGIFDGVYDDPSNDHYQTWEMNMWMRGTDPGGGTSPFHYCSRYGWYLSAADERVHAEFTGASHPYTSGALVGETASRINVSVSKDTLVSH